MKTVEMLYQKYKDKLIPLAVIATDYYAITDERTINRMAAAGKFPGLKPFKMRDSRAAPWMVDIENLAEAIEKRAEADR